MNTTYTPEQIRDMMYGLDTPVSLENGDKVLTINLDNAATTPPFKAVVEKIDEELNLSK